MELSQRIYSGLHSQKNILLSTYTQVQVFIKNRKKIFGPEQVGLTH